MHKGLSPNDSPFLVDIKKRFKMFREAENFVTKQAAY